MVNFKIYDIIFWETNNCNAYVSKYISQEVKAIRQIKFAQLTEYKIRTIFLEKSYKKCGGETVYRPFSKTTKLSISLDQQFKVIDSLILVYVQIKGYWAILKSRYSIIALTS